MTMRAVGFTEFGGPEGAAGAHRRFEAAAAGAGWS